MPMPGDRFVFGPQPFGWPRRTGTSHTIASLISKLLSDTSLRKTYLFLAYPRDPASGTVIAVKISSDGYASEPGDTLYDGTSADSWLFRAGLTVPYNSQNRVVSGGKLSDSPSPNITAVTIENSTGRFRNLLALDWYNAKVVLLLGHESYTLSQFIPLFIGVTAPISSTTQDEINIPLIDNSYKLRRPLTNAKYMGMGAALRGNGSTGFGQASTLSIPAGSMSLECWVRPLTSASTQKNIAGWRSGTAAGCRELRLASTGANKVQFNARNDAGTLFTATATVSISALVRHHICVTLDTSLHFLILYIDYGATTQEIVQISVTGTFNTTISGFTILRLPDASSNFADMDIDEIRVWPSVVGATDVLARKNRQLLASEILLTSAYYQANEGTGTTLFDSVASPHNITLSGTTSWVGTLEGGTEIAGQTPPTIEGVRREVQPVLVDSQNLVYEVARSLTAITLSAVKDKGAATITNDGAVADIYSPTVSSGHYVTAYMGDRVLIRVGALPSGTLTVTATGDTLDTAGIIKKLAITYGGMIDVTEIDTASFTRVTSEHPYTIGISTRLETRQIWDMCQEIARKANGWVTVTRAGLLTIKILTKPVTPRITLDSNSVQSSVTRVSFTVACAAVQIAYRPYDTQQAIGNLSTSLTEAQRYDLSQPYRYEPTPLNTSLLSVRPQAETLTQETLYDLQDDAHTVGGLRQTFWGRDLMTLSLPLTQGLYQYEIGDEVTMLLQSPDFTFIENLFIIIGTIIGYTEVPTLDAISIEVLCEVPPFVTVSGLEIPVLQYYVLVSDDASEIL